MRRSLRHALADFYAPGFAAETFVGRFFALMGELLPAAQTGYGTFERHTRTMTLQLDSMPAGFENAMQAYRALMKQYACLRFDPAFNGGRPYSVRDVFGGSAFAELDIYREAYRPLGFVDHLTAYLSADPDETVAIGIRRDGRPFTAKEKSLLEQLLPHLEQGHGMARAVASARALTFDAELFSTAGFTPRESDVLFWLTQGKSNAEMAVILHMLPESVSRHLLAIYEKLGVENRVAAAVRALELARKLHASRVIARGAEQFRTKASHALYRVALASH